MKHDPVCVSFKVAEMNAWDNIHVVVLMALFSAISYISERYVTPKNIVVNFSDNVVGMTVTT